MLVYQRVSLVPGKLNHPLDTIYIVAFDSGAPGESKSNISHSDVCCYLETGLNYFLRLNVDLEPQTTS